MSNPALVLRGGPSGPTFDPSTPGFVLTIQADGKSVAPEAAGAGGLVSFNGRTTPAAVPTAGDYDASDIPNDSAASGASVADALTLLAVTGGPVPSFPAEDNAGNVTGAVNVSVASELSRRFTLTGNANVTVTGLVAGRSQWFQFKVIQGGAGSFTLQLVGAKTPGGVGLVLSTAVGAVDIISGYWDGTTLYAQVAGLAFV